MAACTEAEGHFLHLHLWPLFPKNQAHLVGTWPTISWNSCNYYDCLCFPKHGCLQIKLMGTRENAVDKDFSGIPLEEEEESHLKDAAVISMGTEISAEDMMNIEALCDQVLPPYTLLQYEWPKSQIIFRHHINKCFCFWAHDEAGQLLFTMAITADHWQIDKHAMLP